MRDRDQTRTRIMEAAKVAFSQRGYAAANVRDIATHAGINAALVIRYFGSKEKLFEEAVFEAFDLEQALAGISLDDLGQAMADLLFSDQRDVDLTAMMVRAALDPTVSPLVRDLAQARMLEPLAKLLGGSKSVLRATTLLSAVTGVWFYRFAMPLMPLANKPKQAVIKHIADLFQRIIDEDSLP
ncbi:TetR/AcrR family transcriptional regulator [Pseudomonas gingeri]|uniref:TetR/AcrR family transcriptional regulator n=1 Tax=Pseudomonas gingeri TaxID=117681 RepID=UPI001C431E82|nr:TetR/AcrR family transcriptional regulator [Pseudomonas gingeri]